MSNHNQSMQQKGTWGVTLALSDLTMLHYSLRLLISLQLLVKLIQGKISDFHKFDLIIRSVVLSHQEK